jgi:predicted DNA-binding protein (UPF0251 family)
MPRPKRIRKVINPPHFKGFRPIGLSEENSPVVLNFEEYEAIRLSDYELHGQVEAALLMDVSRPTYARIYECARRKVAQAFVLGRPIVFEGGKVYFNSEWYSCKKCRCWFNHPEKDQQVTKCALCGSDQFEQYNEKDQKHVKGESYTCAKCGKEEIPAEGIPCNMVLCSDCNTPMMRKVAHQQFRYGNKHC